jgi:hypothetical protein
LHDTEATKMAEPVDAEQEKALLRYQIISAYLAMEPTRGQKGPLLEQLAKKTWAGKHGEPYVVTAETRFCPGFC